MFITLVHSFLLELKLKMKLVLDLGEIMWKMSPIFSIRKKTRKQVGCLGRKLIKNNNGNRLDTNYFAALYLTRDKSLQTTKIFLRLPYSQEKRSWWPYIWFMPQTGAAWHKLAWHISSFSITLGFLCKELMFVIIFVVRRFLYVWWHLKCALICSWIVAFSPIAWP